MGKYRSFRFSLLEQGDSPEKKVFIRRLTLFAIAGSALFAFLSYILLPSYKFVYQVVAGCVAVMVLSLLVCWKRCVVVCALSVVCSITGTVLLIAFGEYELKVFLFVLGLPIVLSGFLFRLPVFIISSILILIGNLGCMGSCLLVDPARLIITVASLCFNVTLFGVSLAAIINRRKIEEAGRGKIVRALDATIFALAYAAELRDSETARHLERSALYTRMLAEELQKLEEYGDYIGQDYIDDIAKASVLHDIGKVGVSDSILLKPAKLTGEEFDEIKKHPEYGVSILNVAMKKIGFQTFFDIAQQIVLFHHEKWDGTGYPNGLSGIDIPISARVVALADVYDAMRSERPYKKSVSHEKCVEIIKKDSGTHFDPVVVDCFLRREVDFLQVSEELRD